MIAERIVHILLEGEDDELVRSLANFGLRDLHLGKLLKRSANLQDERFGFSIHTTEENMIQERADELKISLDGNAWDQITKDVFRLEVNMLTLLRANGLIVSEEGHDRAGALSGSAWIEFQPVYNEPEFEIPHINAVRLMAYLQEHSNISTPDEGFSSLNGANQVWDNVSELGKSVLEGVASLWDHDSLDFDHWVDLHKEQPQLWGPVTEAKQLLDFNQVIGHPKPSGVFGRNVEGTMIYSARCPGCKRIHGNFRTYDEASGNKQCKYCIRDYVDTMKKAYETGNLKPLNKREKRLPGRR